MLRIPVPSVLFPIPNPLFPFTNSLSPFSYYHLPLPLPLQVEMGICTEKSERKSCVFGKQGEAHTVKAIEIFGVG